MWIQKMWHDTLHSIIIISYSPLIGNDLFVFGIHNTDTKHKTEFQYDACLPTVRISVVSTRCQYQGVGVGSQVNKFEQVSSDDHQMFVPGGRVSRSHVFGRWGGVGYPGPMSRREGVPYHATYPIKWIPYPSPNRMITDTCENITFAQILCRAINKPIFISALVKNKLFSLHKS